MYEELGRPDEVLAGVDVEAWPVEVQANNAHIHLPPNFSAFDTVEQAVGLAADQGLAALGTSNYYDYSVYREFGRLCREHGIMPLFGLETIVMEPGLAEAGVRTNDPGNPGKMYVCGKAFSRFLDLSPRAAELLGATCTSDVRRLRTMIDRLNAHFASHGVDVEIRYAAIVELLIERHGVPRDTIYLQERHVALGCQLAICEAVPAEDRGRVLAELFGAEPVDVLDPVALQGDIRTHLMKAGKPAYVDEAFIRFDEAYELVLELGGIPCYPVLADGTDPICELEEPPEQLADELIRRRVCMAELIPIRNTLEQATRFARALRGRGIVMTGGTEHNTLDLIPMAPTCTGGGPLSDELKALFWEGACVVAAHQWLGSTGRSGYVDAAGDPGGDYPDQESRIRYLRALGETIISRFRG